MSKAWTIERLVEAAPTLTKRELEALNGKFKPYLFRRRKTGEVWATCCRKSATLPKDHPVMLAEHTPEPKHIGYMCHMGYISAPERKEPEEVACPFCGREATVKELGRTRNRKNLYEWRRAMVLHQSRGALWAVGYSLSKDYKDDLLAPPSMKSVAIYRFSTSGVAQTKRDWRPGLDTWNGIRCWPAGPLKSGWTFPRPFGWCEDYGLGYDIVNEGQVERSAYRWCGVEQAAQRYDDITRFLVLATAFPRQIEMLMKAGLKVFIDDFINQGVSNAALLDWNERDPAKAFGLSRQELRAWLAAGGSKDQLMGYKTLRKAGVPVTFEEMGKLSDLAMSKFPETVRAMRACRLTQTRLMNYLKKQPEVKKKRGTEEHRLINAIGWWADYIDAAKVLGYDLSNPVFATPKDLRAHHDQATRAAAAVRNARRKEKKQVDYLTRLKKLAKRYTYTDGKYLIRPPVSADEIVAEGSALRHCVGGYADRHLRGTCTILFLRDREKPGKSLVTIEMTSDGTIAQIHGWDDERTACKANPKMLSPRELYADYLEPWLAWVGAGSRRNKQGEPILPAKKQAAGAA